MNFSNTLKQHIVEKYWLDKLENSNVTKFTTFSNTSKIAIPADKIDFLKRLTSGNEIAEFTILFGIYSAILRKYFTDCEQVFSINNSYSKNTAKNIPLYYNISESTECTIKELLELCKQEVLEVLKHINYDPESLQNKLKKDIANCSPYGLIYN